MSAIAVDSDLALVIDDDAKVRDFLNTALLQLGMRVVSFQIAKEALASLGERHPAVIFLDVALLRSDAIDVLRGLGACRYGGVVQLMSGGRPSLLEAVARIGVRHGLRLSSPLNKPFAHDAIAQAIASLRAPEPASPPLREIVPPASTSKTY